MQQIVIPGLAGAARPGQTARRSDETSARGLAVLHSPPLNKGTAFTAEERKALGLTGLLPPDISTLGAQVQRAWIQYERLTDSSSKNIFLTTLHDRNEVLFYRLFSEHLREMIPVVNDLAVGMAMGQYQHECRPPRGVYLSIDHPDAIEEAFANLGAGADDIDLILATDAEQIPGVGDWGVGGLEASIAKLAIYTAAGGIDPKRVIPVMLDVGTNRECLLEDAAYVGNRHPRVRGERYEAFIEAYVTAVTRLFPNALLQWEDFAADKGWRILDRYKNRACTFNENIQGTGAITLAAAISALRVCGTPLRSQRVVIFGAGAAGMGVADQMREAMMREGLSKEAATLRFWCIDREGLLIRGENSTGVAGEDVRDHQTAFARPGSEGGSWVRQGGSVRLDEVVRRVRPTMLIGASGAAGSFTEPVVREMAAHTPRPIIFALSNPAARAEARPADLIAWTEGRALIATGAAFEPVTYKGLTYSIAQVSNAILYPGLALGAIVARAGAITQGMFAAAANAVSGMVSVRQPGAPLLPHVDDLRSVSSTVAIAVADAAVKQGAAGAKLTDIAGEVLSAMWQPEYRPLQAS
jgi:malate dehydrogenase (oxaloacetate-decarboxylating)